MFKTRILFFILVAIFTTGVLLANSLLDANSIVNDLKNSVSSELGNFSNLGSFVGNISGNLTNAIVNLKNQFVDKIQNFPQIVKDKIGDLNKIPEMVNKALSIGSDLLNGDLADVGNAINSLISITDDLNGVLNSLTQLTSVANLAQDVSQILDSAKTSVDGLVNSVQNSASATLSGIQTLANDVQTSVNNVVSKVQGMTTTFNNFKSQLDDKMKKLNKLPGKVASAVSRVSKKIPSLSKVSDAVKKAVSKMNQFVQNYGTKIGDFVSEATTKLNDFKSQVDSYVQDLNSYKSQIDNMVSQVKAATDVNAAKQAVMNYIQNSQQLQTFRTKINDLKNKITNDIQPKLQEAQNIYNSVKSFISGDVSLSNVVSQVENALQSIPQYQQIKSDLEGFQSDISGAISGVQDIMNTANDLVGKFGAFVTDLANNFVNKLQAIPTTLQNAFSEIQTIGDKVSQVVSDNSNVAERLSQLLNEFSNLSNKIYEIKSSFMGISMLVDDIKSYVGRFQLLQSTLDIVVDKIQSAKNHLNNIASTVGDSSLATYTNQLDDIANKVKNLPDVIKNVTQALDNAKKPFENLSSQIDKIAEQFTKLQAFLAKINGYLMNVAMALDVFYDIQNLDRVNPMVMLETIYHQIGAFMKKISIIKMNMQANIDSMLDMSDINNLVFNQLNLKGMQALQLKEYLEKVKRNGTRLSDLITSGALPPSISKLIIDKTQISSQLKQIEKMEKIVQKFQKAMSKLNDTIQKVAYYYNNIMTKFSDVNNVMGKIGGKGGFVGAVRKIADLPVINKWLNLVRKLKRKTIKIHLLFKTIKINVWGAIKKGGSVLATVANFFSMGTVEVIATAVQQAIQVLLNQAIKQIVSQIKTDIKKKVAQAIMNTNILERIDKLQDVMDKISGFISKLSALAHGF
jgi:DNA repair exonuclease SbcCD ATPase subunit